MKITDARIITFKKNGFRSLYNENLKHIKVLPYLSIVQSVEGSYEVALGNDESHKTGEGGFFIAPANVTQTIIHRVSDKSKRMSARWIFLEVEINKAYTLDSLYRFPPVIRGSDGEELSRIFDRIFATDELLKNYSDCYALIDRLIEMAEPLPEKTHNGVRNAVAYMKNNYREEITVRHLSELCGMSESNFYSAFRKHMGTSPLAYLNSYRLSAAADKLSETDDTVSEISYSVGIGDPLYFSKLFKRTYGMTPKEYRRVYRNGK